MTVPGYRDNIKIHPDFQIFVTVRSGNSSQGNKKNLYSLLEKYMYTIHILPLARSELIEIVQSSYPNMATAAEKIVDIFLMFSSGNHLDETSDDLDLSTNSMNFLEDTFKKHSTRLVSTRDLIKLCQRSSTSFSSTSVESSYGVFQNAVDLFCSYLVQSNDKTKLINFIGSKLNIIQSRCEYYSNDHRPSIEFTEKSIKIGRSEVFKKEYNTNKKLKSSKIEKADNSTFSFTRMTVCLLERVAISISQNEPVLLVGETGVGKTTSVQYLAEKTNHKLVVINMSNQSDISDLLGGFKPVDLGFILGPIRTEFESLFRKTFDQNKNEMFLNKFSICYNQKNYKVLVKLMLKVIESTLHNNSVDRNKFEKWSILQAKLNKLHSQLKKSINIAFAFVPGSLVNCIKNGDWVLLDEINLASAETLECLSTILEPNGSVVLLERGDFVPVKRHPSFRIFACMNPSTDIGKKDLATGIRNRFTEYFVDEITKENDLMHLVSDYLQNTGIDKSRVNKIVHLYKNLKDLSNMELNDGLGKY